LEEGQMVPELILISLTWLILFPWCLIFVSEKISLIGVYHNPSKETKLNRICKIGKCNVILSFPLIFSLTLVIKQTVPEVGASESLTLALPISLVSLLALRVLSNPSDLIKPGLCAVCPNKPVNEIISQHKERLISFYYSFICASIIILLIIWSYGILNGGGVLLNLDYFKQTWQLIAYCTCLVIITMAGETILFIFKPMNDD
jgi:hypothetical protein